MEKSSSKVRMSEISKDPEHTHNTYIRTHTNVRWNLWKKMKPFIIVIKASSNENVIN